MNSPNDDPRAALRRGIYLVLIAVGLGAALGRILAVDDVKRTRAQEDHVGRELANAKKALEAKGLAGHSLEEALDVERSRIEQARNLRRPFLGANDRSRWCTVRALVEPDMRVPGAPYAIDRVIQEPNWDTIDMVKHDGHLYSSKPPLLPTLMAAEYWVIYRLTGWSLAGEPFLVGRIMLVTLNGGCLLLYFLAIARLVERLGTSDWGRIFVMAAAVGGTFVTTFAVVINNHLVAAACAAVALDALVRIWFEGQRRLRWFVVAGLAAALLAGDELPALALAAPLSLIVFWKAPWRTLLGYLPAALAVAAVFFGSNWIAHHSLVPAYLHHSAGDNWYDYTYERGGRVIESYWNKPEGIDRGEPSVAWYALNVLVGHHGIFSLTPLWLMSVCGTILWLRRDQDRERRGLAALVAVVSVVCVAFYLLRPLSGRNYGGMNTGFRWVLWMAPLWLAVMLPTADAAADHAANGARRWPRAVAVVLLAASALSAHYATWNPWTNPWIVDFTKFLGWG
ncbi:MAG: hypothetical protein ABSG86_00065 [Thermoguttaceae bacterium]|jgi:hypothetical protein